MGKVLVFAEHSHNKLKRSSHELLTAAKKSGNTVACLVVGSSASAVADEAAQYGAQEVYLIKDAALDNYNSETFLAAFSVAVEKIGPNYLFATSSALGRDLFPRLAAKLDGGCASDCVELSLNGDNLKVSRPLFSGKCYTDVEFQNCALKLVVMRPNQLPVDAPDAGKTASPVEISFSTPSLKSQLKEVVRGSSEKLDLTEANIIVSGGRGLKEAGNFKLLSDLADVLGATVGASRAVVDAGWVPHDMQVGQTGKTVAPTLYIAVGISGAIQHIAGMSASKVIVAINSDANAPIFQKATYGIVGDFAEVLPKLTEEFKKALHK